MRRALVIAAGVAALLWMWTDAGAESFDVYTGTTQHGRGTFAKKAFARGEVVEICPMITDDDAGWGERGSVQDYLFYVEDGRSALALGLCSLYNHSDEPNVEYTVVPQSNVMVMRASRDVLPGEELLISYGPDWWASRGVSPD